MSGLDTRAYSRARLDDRQVTELIGLARGLLADGQLVDAEIEFLRKWLEASADATRNPLVSTLIHRMDEIFADGRVDEEEREDLRATLTAFAAGEFELGEALRSSTLPLCDPAPVLAFPGRHVTFTGTFVFGSRRECEEAVTALGATAGSLRKSTAYLVIGEYATDGWAQSAWGRKVEKAAEMRAAGVPISIVSEPHWREALRG